MTVHLRHFLCPYAVYDVDVGLHSFVVRVTGPVNGCAVFRYPHLGNASTLGFSLGSSTVHHDIRSNSMGKGAYTFPQFWYNKPTNSFQKMRWNTQKSLEKVRRTRDYSLEKMRAPRHSAR